jgi:F0F1-type ATP synthase assembly protein I
MSQSNTPAEPSKKSQTVNNFALYSVGGQVGCASLIIILLAVFAGIALDRILGTKPLFTIGLTLGSAPLSLYISYKLAIRAVKNVTPPEPVSKQTKPAEEEEKRE